MPGTIIDQLTVKFGLDPTDFKKGIEEARKSLDDFKKESKETGSTLGDVVQSGAQKATGGLGKFGSLLGKGGAIGLGIGATLYLGKKLDDALFKVALSLRQVGIESKNVGVSAASLRNLQNASELAGGSVEDAAQTVNDLQKSLFNLRFNGQVSDQIVMLSRLGVQFQDSYGRARDFNDVMLDTADALEKAQQRGEMTRPEAFQFAQQAGFTGGMAQVVLSGRSGVQAELAKQSARSQVTPGMTKGATDWVRASLSLGQAAEAELGNKGVGAVGETRAKADELLERAGTAVPRALEDSMHFLGDAATKAGEALSSLAHSAADALGMENKNPRGRSSAPNRGANFWHSTIAAAAKRHGVPEDVLEGVIRQESSFDPNAVSSKGAKGLAGLMPATGKELGVTPGKNPADDIDAAARYLRQQHDYAAGHGYSGEQMPWVAAVAAYHAGMGNTMRGTNIGPESLPYAGQVLHGTSYEEAASRFQYGPGGMNSTEVNIDQITIQTKATDADGIASDIGDALTRRKLLAGQAEGGIQ